jgi:hypothetical protein
MTASEYPQHGVCEVCGGETGFNEEGSTICVPCGKPTDRCACQRQS